MKTVLSILAASFLLGGPARAAILAISNLTIVALQGHARRIATCSVVRMTAAYSQAFTLDKFSGGLDCGHGEQTALWDNPRFELL